MTTLYRAFDGEGRLLYVGVTDDVERRRREHERHAHWRGDVASWTVEQFCSRGAAEAAELAAIRWERPRWNTVGNPTPPVRPELTPPPLPDPVPVGRRAIDDPVALARAARIVRAGLERKRLELAELLAEVEHEAEAER